MISSATGIGFSSTISLGVVLLGLFGAAFAVWRTQSISALRQANSDLRDDRDDWRGRYETQVTENDRQAQKILDLTEQCQANAVEIARLQERTDTSSLAKEVVVQSFREEMRAAVARLESHDLQKMTLMQQQSTMIETLISRDPSLRTRASDPAVEGAAP